MGVGLQFAASIALFLFGGRWLDGRLGTAPWLMVAGVLLGGAAGFYSIYSKLMRDQRARDEEKRRDREGR
jgi:F0F1-type ATP synthase assembly protein I